MFIIIILVCKWRAWEIIFNICKWLWYKDCIKFKVCSKNVLKEWYGVFVKFYIFNKLWTDTYISNMHYTIYIKLTKHCHFHFIREGWYSCGAKNSVFVRHHYLLRPPYWNITRNSRHNVTKLLKNSKMIITSF